MLGSIHILHFKCALLHFTTTVITKISTTNCNALALYYIKRKTIVFHDSIQIILFNHNATFVGDLNTIVYVCAFYNFGYNCTARRNLLIILANRFTFYWLIHMKNCRKCSLNILCLLVSTLDVLGIDESNKYKA